MQTAYSKEEIKRILKESDFEYHRVNLPYGLHTPGADRKATRDLIFPNSLIDQTVLDIGCSNGYFCFEAEVKGASRVVGIEIKDKRFHHAKILKNILSSNVEFIQQDIFADPLNESFDYVLFLNVIHHLKEPINALRYLASITNKKLIIEFPTLQDPKFKKHVSIFFSYFYNRIPLIGVSSLKDRETDQTFVFNALAIKKILLDHEKYFRKIDILKSPLKGREIAICYK